jgi:hypothetical protein
MEAAAMEAAAMEATTMETAAMETAAVETAAVETAASVKPAAPTMRSSVGDVRLVQRGSEQQSSCGSSQEPARFGLNSFST